jgi:hypothetical protein
MSGVSESAKKHPQDVKSFDQKEKSLYKATFGKTLSIYH